MDILQFFTAIFDAFANLFIYIVTFASVLFKFLGFCISIFRNYFMFILNILPPFMLPFIYLIMFIRLIKFLMGRSNTFTRSASVHKPAAASGSVNRSEYQSSNSPGLISVDSFNNHGSDK